jgi:phage terminase large subunit-like protein
MPLTATERQELDALAAEAERRSASRFRQFFPDDGPFARSKYAKQLEFFAVGAQYKERLLMAANRVGKSEAGAYEVTCHLTGLYPPWWEGRRFAEPVEVWACGTNSQTTRDIVQAKLLGPVQEPGTGMVPAHLIVSTTAARGGLAGAIETALVRHVSGGQSILGLKTYEQGRQSFEGTAKHVIWDDEEPPADVYTEQLYRTITTKGITLVTFTPLQGMSAVVQGFLEPESDEAKAFKWWIQAGWKDVPHLDEAEKRALNGHHTGLSAPGAHRGRASARSRRDLSHRRGRNHRADTPSPQHLAQCVRHGCRLE